MNLQLLYKEKRVVFFRMLTKYNLQLSYSKICQDRYRILYVHSGFSPPIWFGWWLIRLRSRLSRAHRKNINAVSILHPTLTMRVLFLVLRPVLGANFWQKLHYADRVEELWLDDIMSEQTTKRVIPGSVMVYESALIEEGENWKALAPILGLHFTPTENQHDAQ